jgi:hypothetical protein
LPIVELVGRTDGSAVLTESGRSVNTEIEGVDETLEMDGIASDTVGEPREKDGSRPVGTTTLVVTL